MIIVTGAAGFIGSVVVRELNAGGSLDLLVSDRLAASEKWRNLLGKQYLEYIDHEDLLMRLENGDLTNAKIRAIVHIGARTDTTERDSAMLMKLNYDYTIRICKWALQKGVRFIYASSAAVYGDGSLGFSDADDLTPKLQPLNAYAFTKWLFDHWSITNGVAKDIVGLRFFNVYGPNEYHKGRMASVVFNAFPRAMKEGNVQLFESDRSEIPHGDQKRDFVYVRDVARMIQFFLKNEKQNGIYNVGSGAARTFNDLASALLQSCERPVSGIRYIPMPADLKGKYQYFTEADLSRLRAAGFQEKTTTLEAGIGEYVKNYLRKDWERV